MKNPESTFRLPSRGESAFHYCEDIAHSHGWLSSELLLKSCGYNPVKNWFIKKQPANKAISILISPFGNKADIASFEFTFFEDIIPQLRICPNCLNEGKPHRSDHQVPYITHCSIHGTELIDHCPHCTTKILSPLLRECESCLAPLKASSITSRSRYNDFAYKQRDPNQFLSNLSIVAGLIARPWDLLSAPVDWKKLTNKEIVQAFDCAFMMVTDSLAFPQYKEMLYSRHSKNWKLLSPLLEEKIGVLNTAITECVEEFGPTVPLTRFGLNKSQLEALSSSSVKMLPQKRLVVMSDDEEAIEEHCTGRQIIKVFGLDCVTLNKLIEMDICVPISNTRVLNHAIFCFKSTVERINACLAAYHLHSGGEHFCFNHLSEQALKAYGLTKGDIFVSIINGEIEAQFDDKQLIEGSRIFIESSSLLAFINTRSIIKDHITIAEFAEILLVPEDVIEELMTRGVGILNAKYGKTVPLQLDKASLKAFFGSYVPINRIAWLYKIPLSKIFEILRSDGHRPSIMFIYSPSIRKRYWFVKIDEHVRCRLSELLSKIPKRLIQKKWYRYDGDSIFEGIEDCFSNYDMNVPHEY
ncbi:hypothetical protein [Alteromonas ponticola]|uniref:TniQ family protein n=1 Tax=Alteromonas ponticola TaxID=2720613 RepID=A0ABX1R700_9ALTE|nr:hypothetical protein [Alteromonas ponticola]NMH61003.1 hypothetical protein [Alteromonas ponticola]